MKSEKIFIYRILWGALIFSMLTYGLVLYTKFVNTQDFMFHGENLNTIYLFLPLIPLVLSFIVPKLIFKSLFSTPDSKFETPVEQFNKHHERYRVPFIVKLILMEAGAMIGFTLSLSTERIEYFAVAGSLACLCFLINFPTEEKIVSSFRT